MTEGATGVASMRLDLRDVRGPAHAVDRSFPASVFGSEDGFTIAAPVELVLSVRKDGDKYSLLGRLVTTVRRECCRCLEPSEAAVALDIDLRYLPHGVNAGEGEREISDDDLSIAFYRDDEIDLGGLVREQLHLAAPMKPLCDDGCRGLCPACGANRNRKACGCDTVWRDPRFDALRSLVRTTADAEPPRKG
jgi:uncharacterized protein